MLDNTPNQLTKFRARNWVEMNDDARGTYNKNNQIKLKTSILKSGFYDYSDAYILVIYTYKKPISVAPQAGGSPNNIEKKVVF